MFSRDLFQQLLRFVDTLELCKIECLADINAELQRVALRDPVIRCDRGLVALHRLVVVGQSCKGE